MNVEWVPEDAVLRKPKILEIAKMVAKYFSKNGIPFQYDLETRMPGRINMIKLNVQIKGLGLDISPRKMTTSKLSRLEEMQEW
jgi:hypothetical protein